MALPVIAATREASTYGITTSVIQCNLPLGTTVDSWYLMIVGNDDTASVNFTCTDYTAIQAGDGTSDAQVGVLYGQVTAANIAAGYVQIYSDGGDNEMWATILRITGVDETDPINGSWSGTYAGSVETIGSDELYQIFAPIPSVDDCLSIGIVGFDGADVGLWRKYSGSSAAWTFGASLLSGDTGNDASGCWMWADYTTDGEQSSRVTNSSNRVDGNVNLGITLNPVPSANYQETDADAIGTSEALGIGQSAGYALTDANSGSFSASNFNMGGTFPLIATSIGQAVVTSISYLEYTPGWSFDADHFTFDSNDSSHTMDGYHLHETGATSLVYSPNRNFLHTLLR